MPIKTVRFAFDFAIEDILAMVAAGRADMHVDVYGNDKMKKGTPRLNGHAPKLLEAPKARTVPHDATGAPTDGKTIMLKALAASPGHSASLAELREAIAVTGLSPKSYSSPHHYLKTQHWITRLAGEKGSWRLTAEGLRECARRGITVTAAKG